MYRFNFVRQAQIEEFVNGVKDMGAPVAKGSEAEVVPSPPVARVVFLIEIVICCCCEPRIPVFVSHSCRQRLGFGEPGYVRVVGMPSPAAVHKCGNLCYIFYYSGFLPGLELEIVLPGMALVSYLGYQFRILLSHLRQYFGFKKCACHGFFDKNVFSKLHCSHADREVSKVGYCNLNCIYVSGHLVEHDPEVPELFGFGNQLYCFLGPLRIEIHITDRNNICQSGIYELPCIGRALIGYSD